MSRNDFAPKYPGPVKGKPLTWQRIESGYYRLRGTDITVADMQGTSVRWSGMNVDHWEVRIEPIDRRRGAGRVITTVPTLKEAKRAALQHLTTEEREAT